MPYRLGLDIGTNSIGWCALDLDAAGRPCGLRDMGVRIFADGRNPKDKTSLAVQRRGPRAMRRRRDRYLKRRDRLMAALVAHGLMPADMAARKALEGLDPYALRAAALDRPLAPHEIGRALFHLDQRRGFKSNRKTDGGDEKETGIVKQGIGELERRMRESGARTLGEFLHRRLRKGKPARARPETGLYPSRAMYEDEFDAIRREQAPHQPALPDEAWDELRDILLFQRELRPVDPGRCTLDPTEARAPRALPVAQRFRMLQEVANLRVLTPGEPARTLTLPERRVLLDALARKAEQKFTGMARLLKLGGDTAFNLWDEKRAGLKGDETANVLARKDRFGPRWHEFDADFQARIVERLLSDADDAAILHEATADWGLDEAAAKAVLAAPLPAGHVRFGRTALASIVEFWETEPTLRLDEVIQKVTGQHHSDFRPENLLDALPYYGAALPRHVVGGGKDGDDVARHGRIGNPTVHIGLNQLRRLVNRLIETHGRPSEIVVELARELKQNEEQKQAIRVRQARETRANERLRADILASDRQPTDDLLRRLRLWEEQGPPQARVCPYTGRSITFEMVCDERVEIDHIIPFAVSLDDSPANKVLCLREANRLKRRETPFGAFSANPTDAGIRYDYADILRRADTLPANKRWRFHADALERMKRDGDFLARHLNETRHLSRVAREYLTHVCRDVWVLPGTLTAMIRGRLGLNRMLGDDNRKNRDDHRHHALDAVVTALTDRGLLNEVSRRAARSEHRLIDDMPEPEAWPRFRDDVRERAAAMAVSHKPDRGTPGEGGRTSGALHNDTAYGIVAPPDAKGMATVVTRKPLAMLKPGDLGSGAIRDPVLAARLAALWREVEAGGGKWPDFVRAAAAPGRVTRFGTRAVRFTERMSGLVTVADAAGRAYKAYKADGNAWMDIFRLPGGRWKGETVRVFDANRPGFVPRWRTDEPGAEAVARLHAGDMVAVGTGPDREILRVVKLSGQKVTLAGHLEAGSLKARDADKDDPFRYLEKAPNVLRSMGFRPVHVDEIGRVFDRGPLP